MDPITATANTLSKILDVWLEVWKTTPEAQKEEVSKGLAMFCINVGNSMVALQNKIIEQLGK